MENPKEENKPLSQQFKELFEDFKPKNKREWNRFITSWALFFVLVFFILEFRTMYHEAYNMGLQSCLNNLSMEQITLLNNLSYDFNSSFNLSINEIRQIYNHTGT